MALWYYRPHRDVQSELGPVEFECLADMVRDGILNSRSQVRKAETTLWVSITRVRGLSIDDLFPATAAENVPVADAEAAAKEPPARDTSTIWEQALGLAAGELAPVSSAAAPAPERSRRWKIRKPAARTPRINRAGWKWRLCEALAAGIVAAILVTWSCHWYLDQPERYPIPRRLQSQFGEGTRFLFGTGPWTQTELWIISSNLSLLIATAVGIGCFYSTKQRARGEAQITPVA